MHTFCVDTSSIVSINSYAINNFATNGFVTRYNEIGFAYLAYHNIGSNSTNCSVVVKDKDGGYIWNHFNKRYIVYHNQTPLEDLSLEDRLLRFHSLKYLNHNEWFIY